MVAIAAERSTSASSHSVAAQSSKLQRKQSLQADKQEHADLLKDLPSAQAKKTNRGGFRATLKGMVGYVSREERAAAAAAPLAEEIPYVREEEEEQPEEVLPVPELVTEVDPKLENESVLAERRSSIVSQKTDEGKWKVDMRYVGNYTENIDIMRKEKATADADAKQSQFASPSQLKLPLAELKAGSNSSVDPSMKEQYLSEAEFQAVFGMEKRAFNQLPNWKRMNAKKTAGLY